MFYTTIYGFIAKDDEDLIPEPLKPYVSKALLVGVPYYIKKEEKVHWVKCFFWKDHLVNLYPFLTKKKYVIVTGHLAFSPYITRAKEAKINISLKVSTITICKSIKAEENLADSETATESAKPQESVNMNAVFDSIYGKPTQPDQPDLFSHGNDIPDLEIPF